MKRQRLVRALLALGLLAPSLAWLTPVNLTRANTPDPQRALLRTTTDVSEPPQPHTTPARPGEEGKYKMYLPFVTSPIRNEIKYQLDKTYLYDWDTVVRGQSTGQDENGATQTKNEMRVQAKAKLTPVNAGENGVWLVSLRLTDVKITYTDENGVVSNPQDENFARDLARPAYFRQRKDGPIIGVRYDPQDPVESVNVKKGFISTLQTQLGQSGKFSASEVDVMGRYQGHYDTQQIGASAAITRERTENDFVKLATINRADIDDVDGVDGETDDGQIKINDKSNVLFDSAKGVITQVSSTSELFGAGDFDSASDANLAGMAMMSNAPSFANNLGGSGIITGTDGVTRTDGITESYGAVVQSRAIAQASLQLNDIVEADPVALPPDTYETGDLMGAEVPFTYTEPITPSMVALQADPSDMDAFGRLVDALRGNPEAGALLQPYLAAITTGDDAPLRTAIVGALASAGTPQAQQVLLDALVLNTQASDVARNQALVNLALVRKPSLALVGALQRLSAEKGSPLQQQSILVLGAAASALMRKEPAQAAQIVETLIAGLGSAKGEEETGIWLNGLGNAGDGETLDIIQPFLTSDSATVRLAAVDALRTMPNAANLLAARVSAERDPAVRDSALAMLAMKSPKLAEAFGWTWSWRRTIGSRPIYGEFGASLRVERPSDVYLFAQGYARAHAWSFSRTIIEAQGISDVQKVGTVSKRRFLGYVWVLGIKVLSRETEVTCGRYTSAPLISPLTRRFFELDHTFMIGPIPVNLRINAGGSVGVNYTTLWNICNGLAGANASISISPWASLYANGYVGINLLLVRGGAGIGGDIMRTTIPASVYGQILSGQPYLKACMQVDLTTQPIRGSLFLWWQNRTVWPPFGWSNERRLNIWSFSSREYRWNLLKWCSS